MDFTLFFEGNGIEDRLSLPIDFPFVLWEYNILIAHRRKIIYKLFCAYKNDWNKSLLIEITYLKQAKDLPVFLMDNRTPPY